MQRNFVVFVLVALLGFSIYSFFKSDSLSGNSEIPYSKFINEVSNGNVKTATIEGNSIFAVLKSGDKINTYAPSDYNLVSKLEKADVEITAKPPSQGGGVLSAILGWLPMIFFIGMWIYIMRQMQGGGAGKALDFGKSKVKVINDSENRVLFSDVAGVEEAKNELVELVDFLKNSERYKKLGAKVPKGCLLVGPPGTGKTLLARAVAGEANVPFLTISGSDFVEMFVGVGASRVRDLFDQAKKNAPCIIFIDEIDAVGRSRGVGIGGGNDEREQTLNQLLVEMDGFNHSQGVIVMAATNREDVLDQALLRPGRFDRRIYVGLPDVLGREKILQVHTRKTPLGPDVDLNIIAKGTTGFSGASLENLVNEAAIFAARSSRSLINMNDFEQAIDKIIMGPERRSAVQSKQERELVAYHEGGHTITAIYTEESDELHKVTIVPRGQAGGYAAFFPKESLLSRTHKNWKSGLVIGVAGRIAEEIVYGRDAITAGAMGDIKMVTARARAMIMDFGYSDLGRIDLENNAYGGRNYSEATAAEIDTEVKKLVKEAEEEARQILTEHRKELELLKDALLEYETLSADEVKKIISGLPIRQKEEIIDAEVISTKPLEGKETTTDNKTDSINLKRTTLPKFGK